MGPGRYEHHAVPTEYPAYPLRLNLKPSPLMRSRLILLTREDVVFNFARPMPNAWYRLWYRLLLGWRWESLDAPTPESLGYFGGKGLF